jgi:putative transposase
MVRDNRHDSAYLFGAICPARRVGAAIIMPAVNTEAMNEHLKEISTQVTLGAHAVLVCDGAGRHQQGETLCLPDNITLLPLPTSAPELNPMENVREYLRANTFSRLVWDSYQAIVAACKAAWDFLIHDPDRISSIGTRDWACVNVWGGCSRSIVAAWARTQAMKSASWMSPAAKRRVVITASASVAGKRWPLSARTVSSAT